MQCDAGGIVKRLKVTNDNGKRLPMLMKNH